MAHSMIRNMHLLPHTATFNFPQIHWLWTVSATRCFCCPSALLPFFIYLPLSLSLFLLWLLSIYFQNTYIKYKEEQRRCEKWVREKENKKHTIRVVVMILKFHWMLMFFLVNLCSSLKIELIKFMDGIYSGSNYYYIFLFYLYARASKWDGMRERETVVMRKSIAITLNELNLQMTFVHFPFTLLTHFQLTSFIKLKNCLK